MGNGHNSLFQQCLSNTFSSTQIPTLIRPFMTRRGKLSIFPSISFYWRVLLLSGAIAFDTISTDDGDCQKMFGTENQIPCWLLLERHVSSTTTQTLSLSSSPNIFFFLLFLFADQVYSFSKYFPPFPSSWQGVEFDQVYLSFLFWSFKTYQQYLWKRQQFSG